MWRVEGRAGSATAPARFPLPQQRWGGSLPRVRAEEDTAVPDATHHDRVRGHGAQQSPRRSLCVLVARDTACAALDSARAGTYLSCATEERTCKQPPCRLSLWRETREARAEDRLLGIGATPFRS